MIAAQISIAVGLIGWAIGWRGGMIKMRGFYDMPSATRNLMYGFVFGSLVAYGIDSALYRPAFSVFINERVFPADLILIYGFLVGMFVSTISHFLLTRAGVKSTISYTTSGWALGLGVGAMIVVRLGYYKFDAAYDFHSIYTVALMAISIPWLEALILCWHGSRIHDSKIWSSILGSAFAHSVVYFALVYAMLQAQPLAWIFFAILIMLGQRLADKNWIPLSLTPDARRRYRRVLASESRRKLNSDESE